MSGMKGRNRHQKRLLKLRTDAVKAANRVVYVGADMIRAHAFQEISRGSTSGKGHTASTPGEYPNRDTGGLQAHIETSNPRPLVAEVRSEAQHAAALEFGAHIKDGFGKGLDFEIEARPYMRPARDAQEKNIRKLFAEEMVKIIKRSGA